MVAKTFLTLVLGVAGAVSGAHAADDVTIVKQGDQVVTMGDVEGFLAQQMPPEKLQNFLASPTRVNQMLIGILRDKQLAQQAIDMKLDQTPQVAHQLAYARNQILSTQRIRAYEASLKIPSMEAVAKEQYLAHKAEYVAPKVVDVQHILISETGRSEADAKALADKVHAEAVANPASFDELVTKYSDDNSKSNTHGMIPHATSGDYVPEFGAAANRLTKVGDISPVVKTKFGYHILKLIHLTPAKPKDFAEVKDQMVAVLKQNYIDEQRKGFMNQLDDAPASANPDGMEAFRVRYHLDAVEDIGAAIKAAEAAKAKK